MAYPDLMTTTTVNTVSYAVSCRAGSEKKVANNIMKAAKRCCKQIVNAVATPFSGYVKVEVIAGKEQAIKRTAFELPKNAKMVIELTPGVIRVCGNGNEPVPLDE